MSLAAGGDTDRVQPRRPACQLQRAVRDPLQPPRLSHSGAVVVVPDPGQVADIQVEAKLGGDPPKVDGRVVGVAGEAEPQGAGFEVAELEHALSDAEDTL